MCTALSFHGLFGRTLDLEWSRNETVTFTPRSFPIPLCRLPTLTHHHAILGMAHVADGYPLYYDAVNEHGLAMAGLNFVGYADYKTPAEGKDNVASFEFIPWILAQCETVSQAKECLGRINLTDTAFSQELPPAQLHWIIADRQEAITVECVKEGIRVYPNPVGILTNNPPFDEQMFQLNNFMHLSPKTPDNHFSDKLPLHAYSRGMGAMGLPGDLSSQSRFVRGAFVKMNSVSGTSETESVSQFFHILGSVAQPRGCCDVGNGKFETTIYTSCCNVSKGIYYYTTYDNHQITAVNMHKEKLDDVFLVRYPLIRGAQIYMQN
jgi:choloylglycine hydrolase